MGKKYKFKDKKIMYTGKRQHVSVLSQKRICWDLQRVNSRGFIQINTKPFAKSNRTKPNQHDYTVNLDKDFQKPNF